MKHNLRNADVTNSSFIADSANRAHLASQLLIYEHVVIPTNDFALVPGLIGWMGLSQFEEALDTGAISFLRRRGILGYAGNGMGVIAFGISDTPENPYREWWRRTLFGESAEAIEMQLHHGTPNLSKKELDRVTEKVLANSKDTFSNDNDAFIKNVAQESYTDIRDTPELVHFLSRLALPLGVRPGQALAVNRLPGVEPNQMVIAIDGEAQTPVQLVLRVAEVNMQIVMADYSGGTDLHVSEGAQKLLQHKILRSGIGKRDGFGRMLELKRIPDIRAAVATGALALPTVWKVRQHRSSKLFRRWLAKEELGTADDLVRLYIESLEETSFSESLPVRILRFALTTDVGLVSAVAGVAAGVVDSFFANRFLRGYRPKLMFDKLGKLFPKNSR